MRPPAYIAPDLTVRQVAVSWPACARRLAREPGALVGGRWTLQELGPFARDNGWDEAAFLQELAGIAGVAVGRRGKPPEDPSPLPLIFTAIAVCLTLGAGMGVSLLLRIAQGAHYAAVSGISIHVHGVAQLWGWMAMFVMAVATHLLRQNTKKPAPPWLERVAAGFIIAAVMTFFAGLTDEFSTVASRLDIGASGMLAAAAVGFGASMIWSLWGRGLRPLPWHRFVLAMVGWLWIWAAADLLLRIHYVQLPVLPGFARSLLIVLPVLGFATNAIYGFGIRLIPGLLNITQLRQRCFTATWVLHNLGLVALLNEPWAVHVIGAAMMLAAAVVYGIGMNGFRGKASRPIYGIDRRGHVLIYAAFFWLVCGLMMILVQQLAGPLPHAYSGAWRHALTVGFITTLILGVGQRIVPIFIKQPLASTRLLLIGAALILIGNAGRVSLELATIGGWAWTFKVMGITGLLELTALILFGLNLALTLRNRRHVYSAGEYLKPGTRVSQAVNARPQLQRRFGEMGITMFDDAPFIAPSMTFGALALTERWQPDAFLTELQLPSNNVQNAGLRIGVSP